MEFPHLGEHCSVTSCKILDFLPIKCDACSKTFCGDHFSYQSHGCAIRHVDDVQVPVCPMCSCPVTGFRRGDPPDIAVSQHLDNMCKNPGKKVYTNRCSARTCKNKEIVPIRCAQCRRNFCLKHRHPTDHECHTEKQAGRPDAAFSATRQQDRASIERQTREDEELARAIQASLNESSPRPTGVRASGSRSSRNPPLRVPPPTVDQPSCCIS
ncbi:AN1-type zinc finger protein 2A [Galendromus occidentalis]|uniref:AN1-type zinc finger protein 2A n=1 Tax=Galendromus occidentalis TaxID=34638 RepID=A0AAJ7L6Y6_9ACAR|nr:AN1-type zinc finger protein 2A [Galendromus occidentalis]